MTNHSASLSVSLVRLLPKRFLSRLFGWSMDIRWPGVLRVVAIQVFCALVGADPEEAEKPIKDYPTIGQFFTRTLKAGARVPEGELVSPVDGRIRGVEQITSGMLQQVKGVSYSVAALVGCPTLAQELEGGVACNFYLSPKDYHRIHAPQKMTLQRVLHIPGDLWPVNDWSWRNVPALFTVNDRIVVSFTTQEGRKGVLVMVGAYNVGRMSVCCADLLTNTEASKGLTEPSCVYDVVDHAEPMVLNVGDHLGTFHMGSSVVLLWQKEASPPLEAFTVSSGAVKCGQSMVK